MDHDEYDGATVRELDDDERVNDRDDEFDNYGRL